MQNPPINATFALFIDVIYTNKIKANLNVHLFVYDDFVAYANAVDVF
jgi:hypothetical protein